MINLNHSILYLTVSVVSAMTISCQPQSDNKSTSSTEIKVVGAMRNVMMRGQLGGTINLDTIPNKKHLYGIGPIESPRPKWVILTK